jgi:hypothetical protein
MTEAVAGPLRQMQETANALIERYAVPASMIYFYACEDGYRVTVHCQDVRAMCAALGVEIKWKYNETNTRRYVAVIIDGIEFSGSEEMS